MSFNPRPASGAKVIPIAEAPWLRLVSIRAPRAGRKMTSQNILNWLNLFQSAPRERGESNGLTGTHSPRLCFNPRPASGAKGCGRGRVLGLSLFQSAPRERGESVDFRIYFHKCCVSIRAPRAGRKSSAMPMERERLEGFNPRPASGAKADNVSGCVNIKEVSIRAPRAGRKKIHVVEIVHNDGFQSAPRERGERSK